MSYIGPRSRKQAFFKKCSKHGRGLIFAKQTCTCGCACGRACLCAAARMGVRVCERGMRASVRVCEHGCALYSLTFCLHACLPAYAHLRLKGM